MFERFTEKAIKVIMLAQEEARRLGHNFVGTEQILLGLIGEGTGVAAKVLKSMGVNLKDARVEVEKIIGRGSGFVAVEIPFTPRAKRVLELSLEEARQLGHNYIGTEHLLLGLIREGENGGFHVGGFQRPDAGGNGSAHAQFPALILDNDKVQPQQGVPGFLGVTTDHRHDRTAGGAQRGLGGMAHQRLTSEIQKLLRHSHPGPLARGQQDEGNLRHKRMGR